MGQGKFIRPALRKSTSPWLPKDPDLQMGEEHLFEKSRDPLQVSHPHPQDNGNVVLSYLEVAGSFRPACCSTFSSTVVIRLLKECLATRRI